MARCGFAKLFYLDLTQERSDLDR